MAIASEPRSALRGDSGVDYERQDLYITVKAGEVIAELHLPAAAPTGSVRRYAVRNALPLQ